MPSLGMENDGPLEAIASAVPPVRRRPTASWSRAALMNIVRRRTSAESGHSKDEPAGPEGDWLCICDAKHAAYTLTLVSHGLKSEKSSAPHGVWMEPICRHVRSMASGQQRPAVLLR